MRVILFDVDCTLISAGGAGRKALERAFEDLHGTSDVFDFSFGGMTDPGIVRRALSNLEPIPAMSCYDMVIERYLAFLEQEIKGSMYQVLPGVHEVLEHMDDTPFAIGLGTGNVEQGARIKLERGHLNKHFSFGGFGSDNEDRAELVKAGYDRGLEKVGKNAVLIVVGDTPRDVSAAHANGGRCLAVATGGYSVETLQEAGADWVVANLEDPEVARILGG